MSHALSKFIEKLHRRKIEELEAWIKEAVDSGHGCDRCGGVFGGEGSGLVDRSRQSLPTERLCPKCFGKDAS
jgi:hypothetical protein